MPYLQGMAYLLHVILIFLIILIGRPTTSSSQVFDFNPACQQAYSEIIQLKLKSGQALLDVEKRNNPKNLIPHFLENYIDFFILFFNEDPVEYERSKKRVPERLSLISEGPRNSPLFLYTKAVIHFQWAAVQIKFDNNWDAGWEFRRSFLQIRDNIKSFPAFAPNLLYNGTMQVAVGTIPQGYKWLSDLLGMKGSIKNGMKRLDTFLNGTDPWSRLFHDEAVFYYLYLKFYIENDKEGVFDFIRSNNLDLKNNHLFAFLAANLSIHNQQSANARKIISERNLSGEYLNTPVWDLEMGYALLNHLDPNAAFYFERFVASFKGKFYVKDALQKLSWHYYLHDDLDKATYYRKQILQKGSANAEADKEAQKEAETKTWPDKLLLRVRLLSDGGYHREALGLLHGKRLTDFTLPGERLEFSYRVGRIYDDMGRDDEAVEFYKQVILTGEKRKEYFAARAALQIGIIYEQKQEKQTAIFWFRRCLGMKDHEFKNSLDQRAKAGIARCRGE